MYHSSGMKFGLLSKAVSIMISFRASLSLNAFLKKAGLVTGVALWDMEADKVRKSLIEATN